MTVSNTAIVEAFRGKYSSAVVGLLSCQINSCLKELTTKVVSCREIGPAADSKADPKEGPKGDAKKAANKDGDKKKKKADGKDTPTAQKESPFKAKFEVELEDTILFPEGMRIYSLTYDPIIAFYRNFLTVIIFRRWSTK